MPDIPSGFIRTTAEALSITEGTVVAGFVAAGLLLLFSAGVVANVLLISRDRKITFRAAMSYAFSTLWAVPVLAVLAFFTTRAVNHFHDPANEAEISQTQSGDERTDKSARAKLEFKAKTTAPDWTRTATRVSLDSGDAESSPQPVLVADGATVAGAQRKLLVKTRAKLAALSSPSETKPWLAIDVSRETSDAAIRKHVVYRDFVQRGVEKITASRPGEAAKVYENDVYRVYWELDLSPAAREQLEEAAVLPRIWLLGGVVGVLALIVFSVAVYLRLDARTSGRCRFRLKLATTSLIVAGIVAGGLLMTALLPFA